MYSRDTPVWLETLETQTLAYFEIICCGFKGRHGSGNKSNFESGQNKSKACSYIVEDRERMQPLVGDHGHKLQTLFQKEQYFVATYQQQIGRLPSTVSALNSSNCFGDGCPHGARRITLSASADTDICTCCFALSVTTAGQTVNHFLPSFPP